MLDLLKSVIFGIIEGITEWLPVSSTGHLIILNSFLKMDVTASFFKMYEVVIQLGAVLAVVVLYFKRLFTPILPRIDLQERKKGLNLWVRIIISCVPAAIIGVALDKKIDEIFFNAPTVAAALILYGVFFIYIERNRKRTGMRSVSSITYADAIVIGLFQVLALIPGTSRSGATIIGALLIGLDRSAAAEYTFFLAVPVMVGASLMKLLKFGFSFQGNELAILLEGFAIAFLVSIAAIRFLMSFIKKRKFTGFGIYRIALGILVLILYFANVIEK